jgi:hypothetical protein
MGGADLAVVFPTLSEDQILSFDFTSLFSPNESLKAGPITTDVPGNVFVPRQSERYGLLPVTLAKEKFTLFVEPGLRHELFAMALRAPFSEMVSLARRKAPMVEMIRLVKFGQLGYYSARDWSRERSIDLSLNRERPRTTSVAWPARCSGTCGVGSSPQYRRNTCKKLAAF